VKGSLAVPLRAKWKNLKALAWAIEMSCVAIGGRVRRLFAVGDQLARC
jgi:hypothetical protein